MAPSMLPLASTSAARQSENPAPVRSRRSFTSCAGIVTGSVGFVMALWRSFIGSLFNQVSWISPFISGSRVLASGKSMDEVHSRPRGFVHPARKAVLFGGFYGIVRLRLGFRIRRDFREGFRN